MLVQYSSFTAGDTVTDTTFQLTSSLGVSFDFTRAQVSV
jgi:hypothetical protein